MCLIRQWGIWDINCLTHFKYVNSAVWLIFNEKIAESEVCGSREQCTEPTSVHCPPLILLGEQCCDRKVKNHSSKKKKETQTQNALLFSYPNHTLVYAHLKKKKKKKNHIPPLYSYQYANVVFNAKLKNLVSLLL